MTEGNEGAKKLPHGWIKLKLGQIVEFEYGKSLTKSSRNGDGKFPVYGSSGIVGYHDEYLIEAPVLIIGRKGAVGEVWFSEKKLLDYRYYLLCKSTKTFISKVLFLFAKTPTSPSI